MHNTVIAKLIQDIWIVAEMGLEEIKGRYDLWNLLVETARSIPTYNNHKGYVRDILIHEKPDITPEELSAYIGISLGEALIILYELESAE